MNKPAEGLIGPAVAAPAAAMADLPIVTPAAEGTRSALRPPIPSLTGLRFVAAFAVLVGHAMHWIATIPSEYSFIRGLSQASGLGMPLFFVLSGFVIRYTYRHYF